MSWRVLERRINLVLRKLDKLPWGNVLAVVPERKLGREWIQEYCDELKEEYLMKSYATCSDYNIDPAKYYRLAGLYELEVEFYGLTKEDYRVYERTVKMLKKILVRIEKYGIPYILFENNNPDFHVVVLALLSPSITPKKEQPTT